MRHQKDAITAFPGQLVQHRQHLPPRGQVEAAGRFVTQQQRRLFDDGAGDRYSLLLTTGHLPGKPVGEVGQADFRKRFATALSTMSAGEFGNDLHVLLRRQSPTRLRNWNAKPTLSRR